MTSGTLSTRASILAFIPHSQSLRSLVLLLIWLRDYFSLEAALNTNGIRLAAHDSRETLSDAIAAFEQAQLSGGVVVRREPTRA